MGHRFVTFLVSDPWCQVIWIFFMALLLTIKLAVAKRFWLIPSRSRWVHVGIIIHRSRWQAEMMGHMGNGTHIWHLFDNLTFSFSHITGLFFQWCKSICWYGNYLLFGGGETSLLCKWPTSHWWFFSMMWNRKWLSIPIGKLSTAPTKFQFHSLAQLLTS